MVAWKRQLILFGGFHESARLVQQIGLYPCGAGAEGRGPRASGLITSGDAVAHSLGVVAAVTNSHVK